MGVYGFLAVGFGAAFGAWLRWWLGMLLNPVFPTLPLGTLAANLIGGYLESRPQLNGLILIMDSRHPFTDLDLHLLEWFRATGKPLWTFATQGEVDSSPVVVGDKVVFGSGDGRLYLVRVATGKKLWSYDLGKELTASPAVAEGLVVIGCEDGVVYAFGPKLKPSP